MRRHKNLLVALAVIVAVAGAISLGLHTAAEACLAAQRADEVAPAALGDPSQLPGAPRTGRFTAHLEFASDAAPADARLSTEVVWDDDWFFQDPAAYNHELATACAALSAIANAESAYYQVGSGAPASMGRALEALGFEDVSAATYQCDNEALDELVDILTNTADVTAYSVASKRVTNSETGATKTLLLVSVRGSYGSERLGEAADNPSELGLAAADHRAFEDSAAEVVSALADRVDSLAPDGGPEGDVALLFTGFSRAAATANLAAGCAIDLASTSRPLAARDSIYAYTFACPRTTVAACAHDASYDGIFNVLNPSDIVARLPLESWGYARLGHDLWLPEPGRDAFGEKYDAMRAAYRSNVGDESPYDPADVETVDYGETRLGEVVETPEDFAAIGGVAAVVRHVAQDLSVRRVLYGHYPNVYLAWMQAIQAADLRAVR